MEKRAAYGTSIDLPADAPPGSEGSTQHGLPGLAQLRAAACGSGEYALRVEAGRWSALRLVPAAQPAPRPRVPVPRAALVSGGAKVRLAHVGQMCAATTASALLNYLAALASVHM
jgi:hypothetical protein